MAGTMISIGEHNWRQFVDPHIDGEVKKCGTLPRDFRTHPVGYCMHARPFDMELLPESEWEAEFKRYLADQRQLSKIRDIGMGGRPIPARDQNGRGYCVTADTEVLTERGWVTYPEYDWSSPLATVNPFTHAMEFQRPFERHVYEYDGPMVYSTNRRIDFGVTPDHQMYVRKWDERARTLSGDYSFVRAGDLGWYSGLLHAPAGQIGTELVEVEVPGDRRYDGDDFLALLGLIVSDGYAGGSDSTRNWVSFASFRDESRAAVSALAARTGFREKPSQPGVWIRYDAGGLAAWLRENAYDPGRTGARAKRVPLLVKCTSVRQIRHFLSWFDDRNRVGSQFYSTSKLLIDDLQELHLRIGKRSTIGRSRAKDVPFAGKTIHSGEGYVLTVGEIDQLCLDRKKHIETDHYKGLVYCAAVPNHTLLTRRNGSVLISSNCWFHSGAGAALVCRAMMNEPYADISPYAGACLIKNYRDEGGWGSEGVEWAAVNGYTISKYWPQRATDPKYDTPEMRADAKTRRWTEWRDFDPNQMKAQMITWILRGYGPIVTDHNWWSHSICTLDIVSINPFKTLILNSWGDSWSDNGTGILEGSRAVADAAVGALVATATRG